jgi:hypothetical protein
VYLLKTARAILMVAAVTLASAVTVLSTSAPAAAAESGATRCFNGAPPDVDVSFNQAGNVGAVNFPLGDNPPNITNPGDAVTIDVSGYISIVGWPFNTTYWPSGSGEVAPSGWPVPGKVKYASLWRWNNNPGGWIGDWDHTVAFGSCRAAPQIAARLVFLINDDLLWDNGGHFAYRVRIWRSRP